MDARILSVTSLRPQLLRCLGRASRKGEEYIVTKNGKPTAVIIGFDEWERWRETMEILGDPRQLRRLRKNRNYFRKGGKGKSIEQVFGGGNKK